MVKVGAIIPAAGQGKRMGSSVNKQFLQLLGRPVLAHTLALFERADAVSEIIVVGASQDLAQIRRLVREFNFQKVASIIEGGKERQESVYAGVKALSAAIQRVAVHDGARPLLTLADLDLFLTKSEMYRATIMTIPVKDTIKRVDSAGQVVETLAREMLRAVQTPQIFERTLLEEAHRRAAVAGFLATDDAALIEWMGEFVHTLNGSTENIKITTPEDMIFAENILRWRSC